MCSSLGELGKLQMLHENILHTCIKQLLEKKKHTRDAEMVEDLECLCQIMKTVGPRLDTKQAKVSCCLTAVTYPTSLDATLPLFKQAIPHLYGSRPQISELELCVYVGAVE